MKKLLAAIFGMFAFLGTVNAVADTVQMKSSSAFSPVGYDFRIHHADGTYGSWITVPPGQTILKQDSNIANIEIRIQGSTAYGVLNSCHKFLPVGTPDYSDELGHFWDTYGPIKSTLSLNGPLFYFILTGLGSHYCPGFNAGCTVLDCSGL